MKKDRVYSLDWLRGFAVLGMILHHALFAVESVSWMFGQNIWFPILQTTAFKILQELFVGVFLLISGICTAFSRNVLRRGLIVSGAALAVTLVTGVLLPAVGVTGMEIWFGILHMFGLSMLLYGLFTCKHRWVPVITGVTLFVVYLFLVECKYEPWAMNAMTVLGFPPYGFFSADYYPLLPYFFLYLAGTFLGPLVREHRLPGWFYSVRIKPIEWIGRHSLWVYLLHQPLLFGLAAAVFALI